MHCKKRNEPDGLHLHSSLPPKRLMYTQHPQAQSGSEPTCFLQTNFAASYADTTTADRKHSGKRCFTSSRRIIDIHECSKRSRVESSEATVSGVTFQKDLNLHHARKPDAESDSASARRHHDSVFLSTNRLKSGEIRCNENDVDKHRIRCNQTDVDKHGIRCETDAEKRVTFICSRVQESSGNLLSIIARQGTRENAFSCGQSRDDSHSNSRNASFLSLVRDSSNTSPTHLGKSEAVSGAPRSSKHVVISREISSIESLYAPFLDADAINIKSPPPSYVLSSGRLSLEEEARLGRRAPTIDDDFEEYFSSLML